MIVASTKDYLAFVLEQLSGLDGISCRPMMGEYVLYCQGRVVGGIYDDRLLLKPTESAVRLMADRLQTDIPYEGAREMLVADIDDRGLTCRVIEAIAAELPAPKPRKARKESPQKTLYTGAKKR